MHLVDSHLCADPAKYLAAVLVSLTTMLHLGLPHVNVLSKVDLIDSYGPLTFGLNFYTGDGDLSRLADAICAQPGLQCYAKLTRNLCELVQDYGLVSFSTLDVQNEKSMRRLVAAVDKTNGYVFAGLEREAASKGGLAMPHMCVRAHQSAAHLFPLTCAAQVHCHTARVGVGSAHGGSGEVHARVGGRGTGR